MVLCITDDAVTLGHDDNFVAWNVESLKRLANDLFRFSV